jgi:hypothetical protein
VNRSFRTKDSVQFCTGQVKSCFGTSEILCEQIVRVATQELPTVELMPFKMLGTRVEFTTATIGALEPPASRSCSPGSPPAFCNRRRSPRVSHLPILRWLPSHLLGTRNGGGQRRWDWGRPQIRDCLGNTWDTCPIYGLRGSVCRKIGLGASAG